MKKIFCLLGILFGVGVSNAATMCVPDLSTCDSCTDGAYNGIEWKATCCGVEVSGISTVLHNVGSDGPFVFNLFPSLSVDEPVNGLFCGCVVLRPVASVGVYLTASNANCSDVCVGRTTDVLRTLSKDNLLTEVPGYGGQ